MVEAIRRQCGTLFLGDRHSFLLWHFKHRNDLFQRKSLCLYYLFFRPSLRPSSLHNFRYGIKNVEGGIGFVPVTNTEMDSIQVHNPPMGLQRTPAPAFKLLGEGLIEATDRNSQQRLGHITYFVGTRSGHEHLGETFCDVLFKATVAVKDLRVELAFAVSGNLDLLDPTG